MHTDITTCDIEKPHQKYRLGTGINRLLGQGLKHVLLNPNSLFVCNVRIFIQCVLFISLKIQRWHIYDNGPKTFYRRHVCPYCCSQLKEKEKC